MFVILEILKFQKIRVDVSGLLLELWGFVELIDKSLLDANNGMQFNSLWYSLKLDIVQSYDIGCLLDDTSRFGPFQRYHGLKVTTVEL